MVVFANALATDPVLGAIVTALVRSNELTITPLPLDTPGPPSDVSNPRIIPHRVQHHRQCAVVDSDDDDEAIGDPESPTEWKEYPPDFGPSMRGEVSQKKGKQRHQDRQVSATSSFPDDEMDSLIANLTILDDHEVIFPNDTALSPAAPPAQPVASTSSSAPIVRPAQRLPAVPPTQPVASTSSRAPIARPAQRSPAAPPIQPVASTRSRAPIARPTQRSPAAPPIQPVASTRSRTLISHPAQHAPAAPPIQPGVVAGEPKLYDLSSTVMTGTVESWQVLVAGHLVDTLHDSRARRINRPPHTQRHPKSLYVVFAGVEPGLYDSWDEAKEHVLRIPGANFKGYNDRLHAERAWLAANVAGTVRVLDAAGHARRVPPTSFPPGVMTALIAAPDAHFDDGWYVVSKGRTTGVFPTWNLAASQTQGIAGSIYEKFPTKAAAEAAYRNACQTGITQLL